MKKYVLAGTILVIISCLFFLAYKHQQATYQPEYTGETELVTVDTVTAVYEPERLYGFNLDSFNVHEDIVKRNQTLSDILKTYNIDPAKIYEVATSSRKVFDVRKIGYRKNYTVFTTKDSAARVVAMAYEPDKTEFVVFHMSDSVYTERVQKEKVLQVRAIAAKIESSLYETLINANVSPMLVSKLVDMYAWQIDFFHIDANDYFKVIFEEELIEGEVVNIPRVVGAYFYHAGRDFYSVYYNQGDGLDYFDEEGNSLRKAFLKAPVNFSRISSRYSGRRFHPVLKRYRSHLGTDYVAQKGTPIYTVGDGVVTEATYNSGNGNYVKIRHNATYTTQYLHMSKIASGMRPGKAVKQGEVIGYVGSTGLATGPHVCFRFWRNGVHVDPFSVEIPPSQPIADAHKEAYFKERDKILSAIDTITFLTEKPVLNASVD